MSRAKAIPTRAAASTPTHKEPLRRVTRNPVMAPMSMMPSIPRFSTPARSEIISPRVAKIMGVAIRIMAPRSPAMNAASSMGLMIFAPP